MLKARGLKVTGLTTDGSTLYSTPIAQVFGTDIPHQVCQFHVIKEINQAVLKAVAKVRREINASLPKLGRGRPTAARKAAAQKKRGEQKTADLFDNRYLFVQHHLAPTQRKTLHRVTRGLPHLRTLRDLVDEVYRLFDRRCRADTALAKLAKLRHRVARFKAVGQTLKKLFSPTLEKA